MNELPLLTKLENTGNADRYEYRARDGVTHRFIVTNEEKATDPRALFDIVRDKIHAIEGYDVER